MARTDVRDMYVDIHKQVQNLRSGKGGSDIDLKKVETSVSNIESKINSLLATGNISKAQKLMTHLAKAKELKEVAKEIQDINDKLKKAGATAKTGLNQELLVATQKFKDLKEEVMDVEGAFGKVARRIESIVGPGAMGAGVWSMTQNTLKLESATLGYGEALDKITRPGSGLSKLIDYNFEWSKFKAQFKGAKDFGVPVEAINEAVGELIPYSRQLKMSFSEINDFAPKLGAAGRLIRQDMGSSLEYIDVRMHKMEKSSTEVLDEMSAMRSIVDKVNENYGAGTLRVEEMSNVIFDLAKKTRGYGMDTEYLSLVLGRHAGRLKSTGRSYQDIKESMKDFGDFLTDIPEHWKFDLGEKIFGGITNKRELEEFIEKQGWSEAIKSKLSSLSDMMGGPDNALFQQAAFQAVSQEKEGINATLNKLATTNPWELSNGTAEGMLKAADLIQTAKDIQAGTKDISEFKKKILNDMPKGQIKTFEEGAKDLKNFVGQGIVNEIKAAYSVIQSDFAKVLGGAVVTAHSAAMRVHTLALWGNSGTLSKLGGFLKGGMGGGGGLAKGAGIVGMGISAATTGYAAGTLANNWIEENAPGVNRWIEDKLASFSGDYRKNVKKTKELQERTKILQEEIRRKREAGLLPIPGSTSVIPIASGNYSNGLDATMIDSSTLKATQSIQRSSAPAYMGDASYSHDNSGGVITIKARMVGGAGELVAAGMYENREF